MLFIFCALIPISALSAVTFYQVKNELYQQSRATLKHLTKYTGMAVYERLLLLETELQIISTDFTEGAGGPFPGYHRNENGFKQLLERFTALSVFQGSRKVQDIIGAFPLAPDWSAFDDELSKGKTILFRGGAAKPPVPVYMARHMAGQGRDALTLVGEVNPDYLWGYGEGAMSMPYMTEFSVLSSSKQLLVSSLPNPDSFLEATLKGSIRGATDSFDFHFDGTDYLACYWTLFLQSHFAGMDWIILLSQDKASVSAPIHSFKKMFPLVLLLSFWVVLLLSVISIRKSLIPLERLKAGTLRIAGRDFKTRVSVDSGDEFEDLAGSFNLMSAKLDRQFQALTTIAEIDRMILSSLETEKIIEIVLTRLPEIVPCQSVLVCLIDLESRKMIRYHMNQTLHKESYLVVDADLNAIMAKSDHLIFDASRNLPTFLFPLSGNPIDSVLVFPVFLHKMLSGVIAIGVGSEKSFQEADIDEVRQIADHVAIALANADLIHELDQLNWGTMMALARTVDAKSPWTAGHSERVTELSLSIGRAMGLPPGEINILHRACLLHDIGKMGVPAAILDKGEKLSVAEFEKIKEHPRAGARILEPIGTYEKVIPIVLQHHERFDGSGYPFGLAGAEIDFGARILAVADVYDSLFNDRPYRAGWSQPEVIKYIRDQAGIQFDPAVVQAFLEVIDKHSS